MKSTLLNFKTPFCYFLYVVPIIEVSIAKHPAQSNREKREEDAVLRRYLQRSLKDQGHRYNPFTAAVILAL